MGQGNVTRAPHARSPTIECSPCGDIAYPHSITLSPATRVDPHTLAAISSSGRNR